MKKIVLLTLIPAIFLLFNQCSQVADASGVCAKKWIKVKPISASTAVATITGSALVLYAPNLKAGVNLTINQTAVSGDFEAEASFEDFTPGTLADTCSAFLQFSAIPIAENEIANTGIANVSSGLASSIFAGNEADAKPFLNKEGNLSGTLKIKRTGNTLTITTIVNSKSMLDGSTIQTVSTATKTDFGNSNLNIGFQLGALKDVNKVISAKITNFTIVGGGSLAKSDAFDCNSLL
ncbi:MAG: hypothetical protein RL711_287 [Bacteroidota bacterium]|jgi:hypothetical protein